MVTVIDTTVKFHSKRVNNTRVDMPSRRGNSSNCSFHELDLLSSNVNIGKRSHFGGSITHNRCHLIGSTLTATNNGYRYLGKHITEIEPRVILGLLAPSSKISPKIRPAASRDITQHPLRRLAAQVVKFNLGRTQPIVQSTVNRFQEPPSSGKRTSVRSNICYFIIKY